MCPGISSNADVQLWDCQADSSTSDQFWKWRDVTLFEEGGEQRAFGRLENRASGKCLDVIGDDPSTEPQTGDRFAIWDCGDAGGNTKQHWHLHSNDFLWNSLHGCLDITGSPGTSNGDVARTDNCEFNDPAGTDQSWQMDPVLPTCSAFSCPAGYLPKPDVAGVAGSTRNACCDVACSAFSCPSDHLPKPYAAKKCWFKPCSLL
ncbi:xlnA [Symbiodinium natans]|uniref:XlnA protein n=1 Tax=Symbiodinium natans TaxID=878477 RepID=A0A812I2M9_9DINO|nr:xlnA [Symbiodinium natans]